VRNLWRRIKPNPFPFGLLQTLLRQLRQLRQLHSGQKNAPQKTVIKIELEFSFRGGKKSVENFLY
jgi:hypothetical protein